MFYKGQTIGGVKETITHETQNSVSIHFVIDHCHALYCNQDIHRQKS